MKYLVALMLILATNTYARDMILIDGQSNSNGTFAEPVVTPNPQAASALMFDVGVRAVPCTNSPTLRVDPTTLTAFAPLHEEIGQIYCGQTIASSMAWSLQPWDVLMAACGVGAQKISALSKGTVPYQNCLDVVARAHDLDPTITVPAIAWLQGESDALYGTSGNAYLASLLRLQSDLCADIKTITGQVDGCRLILDQVTQYPGEIAQAQLEAALIDWPDITLVGPLYPYRFIALGNPHLTATSQEYLGEQFAEAYQRRGQVPYAPIRIAVANMYGPTVRAVYFPSPDGPIALDAAAVSGPTPGLGWKFEDDCNDAQVVNVYPYGPTTVNIELSTIPLCAHPRIRYALDIVPPPGQVLIRDSATKPSILDGSPLRHWAVAQEIGVQ